MNRTIKDYILISLKGVAMGAADVIPGVSGGTIAFISGIYQELLDSINSINIKNIKLLFKEGIKKFWNLINANFLVALVLGIGISIFSLAKLLHFLLEKYPILIWSFFFGLIIASAIYVAQDIKNNWNYKTIISLIIGIIIAYFITIITPAAENSNGVYWYVFISGMIAICAMILPGISGSFILLLMGQYKFILSVVNDFKISYILTFGAGAIIGLLSFSKLIAWLLKNYYNVTITFLVGFMIGSLNKIWPWKHTVKAKANQFAEIIPINQENVLPNEFYESTGKDPQTFYAILMVITGLLIIFVLQVSFSKIKNKEN